MTDQNDRQIDPTKVAPPFIRGFALALPLSLIIWAAIALAAWEAFG